MSDPDAVPTPTVAPAELAETVAPLLPLSDLLNAWAVDAEAAQAARLSGVPRGPVTGLTKLDRELGGYLAPGLHVLHGEPGTGKSAVALQVAALCRFPALYVTTEMGPLELLRRITARVTGTYLGRLKSGELDPSASLALAARGAESCPMLALLDATQVAASAAQVEAAADLWQERHAAAGVLVVIDSLHTWSDAQPVGRDAVTEYDRLNLAIDELRRLAGRLGAPVLAIAERNRASMGSGSQNAAAGSRKFEYQAESVLALLREGDDWREDAAGEYTVSVKVAKNRNGRTGHSVPLKFNGALQTFREL